MGADALTARHSAPFAPRPGGCQSRLSGLRRDYRTATSDLRAVLTDRAAHQQLSALTEAVWQLTRGYAARVRQLETDLLNLLARDGMAPDDRAAVVAAAYPGAGRRHVRDAQLLTDSEAVLIGQYRSMDRAGRAMVRTLLERLAASATPTGGAS